MEKERLRLDQGQANDRIVRKEPPADFRRIESSCRKILVHLRSAEMKRLYLRLFNDMQIQVHYISVLARVKLDHTVVMAAERQLLEVITHAIEEVDKALDVSYALCTAHGISIPSIYLTVPMELEALVISGFSRRYLDLFLKVDQLMLLLETLFCELVIDAQELNDRKYVHTRAVRRVTKFARATRYRLQRLINEGANRAAAQQRSDSVGARAKVTVMEPGREAGAGQQRQRKEMAAAIAVGTKAV